MRQEGKHFFSEEKKQKTFTPLSREGGQGGGRNWIQLAKVAVVAAMLTLAVTGLFVGVSSGRFYFLVVFCSARIGLDWLDPETGGFTEHAWMKRAFGFTLLSLVLPLLLSTLVFGVSSAQTMLSLLLLVATFFLVAYPPWSPEYAGQSTRFAASKSETLPK